MPTVMMENNILPMLLQLVDLTIVTSGLMFFQSSGFMWRREVVTLRPYKFVIALQTPFVTYVQP